MALVGSIVKEVAKHRKGKLDRKELSFKLQEETLRTMINKAKKTMFGKKYGFEYALGSHDFIGEFQQNVPVYDYDKIFNEWWHKLLDCEKNVCWPGKVKYFGLTSGTANDTSKRVPITTDMIKSMRKVGIRQFLALSQFDLPPHFFEKSILMIGGSTSLMKISDYFEGDLSGILASKLPFWFQSYYKPGKISKEKDWAKKLDKIILEAPKWDISGITGVPAWVQILLEKIIDYYSLKHIHEIWPNFAAFAHGGVCFSPYKKSFEQLLGREVHYIETYLASEGFLAYQRDKEREMQLVLDNGIFFEFIPFNSDNFHADGTMVDNPQTLLLNEVEERKDYAVILSTVAGAWRYLIGDTIKFITAKDAEFVITGRTKHFLSLCGEHLSVDNMNKAICMVSDELGIEINEYTVAGIPYENLFAHKWYIGVTKHIELDKNVLIKKIDNTLKQLNDDYGVERTAALKEVFVEILPVELFYKWMRMKGKEGGQHKFPRVINRYYEEWENFIKKNIP